MKVVMLTPWVSPQGGGVAEAVRLLAGLMSVRPGMEVEVLSVRERAEHSQFGDWGEATISVHRYLGPSNYRFSPGLLWRLLRSNADLVHVHGVWTFQCLAVLIWSALTRRPYVVSPHGMLDAWILARSRRLKAAVTWLYQRQFLNKAAAFHALTERELNDVHNFAPQCPGYIVPNFVERPINIQGKPHWWRPDLEGATIYVFLGRIHEKKGWYELCQAWESICATDAAFAKDSRLVFCGWIDGSPQFEPQVQELAERYHNVLIAGPQFGDARAQSLAVADALVLPSRSEGLPMTVLEAWAAGVPVLMTRACNLPIGFEAGAAIEIGWGSSEIADGLRQFADLSAERRRELGEAGIGLIERQFSRSHAGEAMKQIYEGCHGRH